MAAKAFAHGSYFEQAAVKEFLLKTEEEKKMSWYLKILFSLQQSDEEEGQERAT